jgi:hypothetical protein
MPAESGALRKPSSAVRTLAHFVVPSAAEKAIDPEESMRMKTSSAARVVVADVEEQTSLSLSGVGKPVRAPQAATIVTAAARKGRRIRTRGL